MKYTVADNEGFFHVIYSERGEESRIAYTEEELTRLPKWLRSSCNRPGQEIMFPETTMKLLSEENQ